MDELICYICNDQVSGYLNGLSHHFTRTHGLTITRGMGSDEFKCGQDGCQRRYYHFSSLRKHIRECHPPRVEKSEEFIIPDEDISCIHNYDDNKVLENQRNDDDDQENINMFFNDKENINFDLHQHIMQLVEKLQSGGYLKGTLLTEVLDDFERLVLSMQNFFKIKVQTFFQNRGLLDDDEAKLFLNAFDLDNPFDELRNLYEETASFEEHFEDIKSEEISPVGLVQLFNSTLDQQPSRTENSVQSQPHCNQTSPLMIANDPSRFSRYGTVTKTLENYPRGRSILSATQSSFTEKDRKCLIRILVSELVKVHDSHYPPLSAKIALAKAIVSEFPRLRNNCASQGYEHYFDENTKKGFIEFRLWAMRVKLSPSKKKYNVSDKKEPLHLYSIDFDTGNLSADKINEKISMMKSLDSTEDNKNTIIQGLHDTYLFRRKWILLDKPSVTQIFQTYPRLIDYNGEMIILEFKKIYPKLSDNFMSKFPTYYTPRILCYAKKFCPAIFRVSKMIENEQLRALLILAELLPISNALKKGMVNKNQDRGKKRLHNEQDKEEDIMPLKYDFPNKFLLRLVPKGTNLESLELQHDSEEDVSPYLILINGQEQGPILIKGHGWLLNISENLGLLRAFDILYKFFYVFSANYPRNLLNFYNFIDAFIYETPVRSRNVVSSLHINISNIKMDENNTFD